MKTLRLDRVSDRFSGIIAKLVEDAGALACSSVSACGNAQVHSIYFGRTAW